MNKSFFNTTFARVIHWLVPSFIRGSRMSAWLNALAAPMQHIREELLLYRAAKNHEISMTGQRIYLERLLNDLYDPVQRRIRVVRINFIQVSYSYNRAEAASDRFEYNRLDRTLLYQLGEYGVDDNILYRCIVPVESPFVLITFEDATKDFYGWGNVTLSGLSFEMADALIGGLGDAHDFFIDFRSARMWGTAHSSITMMQDISRLKSISFSYRRYGTDPQVDWMVQCSTNGGMSWFQVGDTFMAPANNIVQEFSAQVNITGPCSFRIIRATETGTSDRRLNIDNIRLTRYAEPSTLLEVYFEQVGPVHFLQNKIVFDQQHIDFMVQVPFQPAQLPVEAMRIRRKVEQYNITTQKFNINSL